MSPLGKKIFNEGQLEKQKEIAKNLMDILNDEMIAKKCDLSLDYLSIFSKIYRACPKNYHS